VRLEQYIKLTNMHDAEVVSHGFFTSDAGTRNHMYQLRISKSEGTLFSYVSLVFVSAYSTVLLPIGASIHDLTLLPSGSDREDWLFIFQEGIEFHLSCSRTFVSNEFELLGLGADE
jgi:hypothetical protein